MDQVAMPKQDVTLAGVPEAESACYLYAVARLRDGCNPGTLPPVGIVPDAPVATLTHRDLVAVISQVSLAEFGPDALTANLQNMDWAQARVLAHQSTLAGLLNGYTLIPFKFCSVYPGRQRVEAMMAEHYPALDETLRRLTGATEWGVKVFCERHSLVQWIAEKSEELRSKREAIALASAGAGYFLRKKLDAAAENEAERVVDACVQASHSDLANQARQALRNPVQSPAVHGRKSEMVLNGAYFVSDNCLETFQSVLESLETRYASKGFTYELTGPWPPYNFAALDLEEAIYDRAQG